MKTISYRIVHHGDTLTTWKTNEMGISDLVHIEEHSGCNDCGQVDFRACDDAVNRSSIAAEADYGDILPWIAATSETSSLVLHTGPLVVRVPA